MNKPRIPYRPTKGCPHRYCRLAHSLLMAVFVLFLLRIITSGLQGAIYLVFIILLALVTTSGTRLMRTKRNQAPPTFLDMAIDDLKEVDPVMVRLGWARTAVVMDVSTLVLSAAAVGSMWMSLDQESTDKMTQLPAPDGSGVIGLVLALSWPLFNAFAHWKATRPRKRKRVFAAAPNAA